MNLFLLYQMREYNSGYTVAHELKNIQVVLLTVHTLAKLSDALLLLLSYCS